MLLDTDGLLLLRITILSWFIEVESEMLCADGLSRRPQEYEKMFPEVVNAICQAYIVMHEDCPYVENLVVNCSPVIVDAVKTYVTSPEGTDLGNINWQQEQMADRVFHRVIELIKCDYRPQQGLTKESADVSRYFQG